MDHLDWDARYASADLVWGAEPNRFVVEELGAMPPRGRALDLACGEGRNAIWLAEQGWDVTAVDFSRVAIERARQLASKRGVAVEWVREDLLSYAPEPRAFGLALIAYLQVPGPDLRRVLDGAASALAPDGELVMIGHARRNLEGGWGGPRDPEVLWTPEALDEALRARGLHVVRCEHVRRPVDSGTPADGREAIDVLVRAQRPA
jgi:SAM-dependent methyltransferase